MLGKLVQALLGRVGRGQMASIESLNCWARGHLTADFRPAENLGRWNSALKSILIVPADLNQFAGL